MLSAPYLCTDLNLLQAQKLQFDYNDAVKGGILGTKDNNEFRKSQYSPTIARKSRAKVSFEVFDEKKVQYFAPDYFCLPLRKNTTAFLL